MIVHAKPQSREEKKELVHAETRRRGELALGARVLFLNASSLKRAPTRSNEKGAAGNNFSSPSFFSASPRLRVNPIVFASSRLRVNQSGPAHV